MDLAHGKSIVSVDHDIIIVEMLGSFNKEGVIELNRKLTTLIHDFKDQPFKILLDYLNAEGGTPEAFQESEQFNHWLNNKKLAAKAVVTTSSLFTSLLDSRVPARKQQNLKCFDNISDATAWLNLQ